MQAPRRYSSYSFLTATLDGGQWSASRHGRALPLGKEPRTHWIDFWVGFRACLDTEIRGKILCLCLGSNPGRSVCSQTLQGDSTLGERTLVLFDVKTVRFRLHKYRNGGQLWAVNVFSYTIRAQTVGHRAPPLPFLSFSPLTMTFPKLSVISYFASTILLIGGKTDYIVRDK
jgi:hypothetical protein